MSALESTNSAKLCANCEASVLFVAGCRAPKGRCSNVYFVGGLPHGDSALAVVKSKDALRYGTFHLRMYRAVAVESRSLEWERQSAMHVNSRYLTSLSIVKWL